MIVNFLEDGIVTRFGVPAKITTNNTKAFSSISLSSFCCKYGIILSHSSNYYPRGNSLAEWSDKNLMNIIKKTVGENNRSWVNQLKYALWADRITKKDSIGKSPFELVYGMEVTLPTHLKLPVYKIMEQFSTDARKNQPIDRTWRDRETLYSLSYHLMYCVRLFPGCRWKILGSHILSQRANVSQLEPVLTSPWGTLNFHLATLL